MKIKQLPNGRYETKVYLGFDSVTGGQRTTTIRGKTKKEVELEAASRKIEFKKNGNTIIPKIIPLNFEELTQQWLEEYKLEYDAANTIKQRESILKIYLIPELGKHKIDKITPLVITSLVKKWASNAKESSDNKKINPVGKGKHITNIVNVLKQIFDYAVRMDLLESNPVLKVKVPKPPKNKTKREVQFLNKTEARHFIDELLKLNGLYESEVTKAFFFLLIMTGIRISEGLALRWDDVDLTSGLISISKTLNDSGVVQDTPKTKSSNRELYLNDAVINTLKEFKKIQTDKCQELRVKNPDYIFFHLIKGEIYKRQRMSDKLRIFLKDRGMRHFTPHALRHTVTSLSVDAGIDIKEVSEQMGHESVQTTLDIYRHISSEEKRKNANKLSDFLNN